MAKSLAAASAEGDVRIAIIDDFVDPGLPSTLTPTTNSAAPLSPSPPPPRSGVRYEITL